MKPRPFPPARPHGDLQEVIPDVFLLTGSMSMGPMRFSRNMVVVREGRRLILINTVRLTEEGLNALDALGEVTDVLRVGGFHGSDDPFYKDRYGCKVQAIRGQAYFTGLKPEEGEIYYEPDILLEAGDPLPIKGASLYVISTRPPEAIIRLPHGGGTLVSSDSLHNWGADRYFNLLARVAMKLMGFLKPCQVGPGWAKSMKPSPDEVQGILELDFEAVLPGHGAAVLERGPERYRPSVEAYCARAR